MAREGRERNTVPECLGQLQGLVHDSLLLFRVPDLSVTLFQQVVYVYMREQFESVSGITWIYKRAVTLSRDYYSQHALHLLVVYLPSKENPSSKGDPQIRNRSGSA